MSNQHSSPVFIIQGQRANTSHWIKGRVNLSAVLYLIAERKHQISIMQAMSAKTE
jgi:hypothetical protein